MSDWSADPVVVELRQRIADADRAILARVNERIALVEQLRRYKEERGYPFTDRAREEWLIDHLTSLNAGPLSEQGVRELFTSLIDLVKREVADGRLP